jgi:hypothetical protein
MDPLVPANTEAPVSPVTQTEQPATDIKLSVVSWLEAAPDSKEADFIVSQVKGKTIIDALTELKDIERRVGPPQYGETRVQKLYNYMKVLSTFNDSRKELDALER